MAILSDSRTQLRAETGEIDASLAAKMDVVSETPTENAIVTLDDEGNAQDSGVPIGNVMTTAELGSQEITADAATCVADMASGKTVVLTLAADTTLTITGPRTVDECLIFVQQDTEGTRLLTIAGGVWAGGTAATMTTTASAVDVIRAWTVDGWTTVYCEAVGLAFAAPE